MQHFGDWVTDPRLSLDALRRFRPTPARIGETRLDDDVMWTSSGSSGGEPEVFVQDAHAMAVYDALEALRRRALRRLEHWLLHAWSGERFAFVGATEGHFASTVSVERLRRLFRASPPRYAASPSCCRFPNWPRNCKTSRPPCSRTYRDDRADPGAGVACGTPCIAPEEISTGDFTAAVAVRRFVEESFGCRVGNSYGASEFLFAIGAECRCGQMHVNEDW